MEYQGFNGTNYDEDDEERKKAGGIVAGFRRDPASPQQNTENLLPTSDRVQHFLALQKLRENIMSNQNNLDKMQESDPGYQQALDYQDLLEKQFANEPQHEEFMKELQKQNRFQQINNVLNQK